MNRPATYALRSLWLLILLLLFVYAGDYLSVRLRMRHPASGDPFESPTRTIVRF